MRFGGMTEAGRGKALMRSLKSQLVFDAKGSIRKPNFEICFQFSNWRRSADDSSAVTMYYRAVSDEVLIRPWTLLFGSQHLKYKLNISKLNKIIEESYSFVESKNAYSSLRWHDIVLLLLMVSVFPKNSTQKNYATNHLNCLIENNPTIREYYDLLS